MISEPSRARMRHEKGGLVSSQSTETSPSQTRSPSLRKADRLTVVCLCAAIGAWELACLVFVLVETVGLAPLLLSWFASIVAVVSGHSAQYLRRRNRLRLPRRLVAGLVLGWLGVVLTCPVVVVTALFALSGPG